MMNVFFDSMNLNSLFDIYLKVVSATKLHLFFNIKKRRPFFYISLRSFLGFFFIF